MCFYGFCGETECALVTDVSHVSSYYSIIRFELLLLMMNQIAYLSTRQYILNSATRWQHPQLEPFRLVHMLPWATPWTTQDGGDGDGDEVEVLGEKRYDA
jgi:hypothetical protein